MPPEFDDYETPSNWLSFEEMLRVSRIFVELGVSRIRLTGGEPLVRARIDELAHAIGRLRGLDDLSVSTNGTRLKQFAHKLGAAGVKRLNVSLDTLSRARFQPLTGRDALPEVLAGLEVARTNPFQLIKINMVWLPDTGGDELEAMIEYCMARGFVLRLIEHMPMGNAARASAHPRCSRSSSGSASVSACSITLFPAVARRVISPQRTALSPSASSPPCRSISAPPAIGFGSRSPAPCTCVSDRNIASNCCRCCAEGPQMKILPQQFVTPSC